MSLISKVLWFGILLLALLCLSFASYHSTDSTEIGVRTVKWFGKPGVQNQAYQPGAAYFFPPINNEWDTFDTRLQIVEMKGPQGQLVIKTRDGNDLFVDVNFSYRIDPQ